MLRSTRSRLFVAVAFGCSLLLGLLATPAGAHPRHERCAEAQFFDEDPGDTGWTDAEVYVWEQACAREWADLDIDADLFGDALDDPRRQLRRGFLREILTEEPFKQWLDGHPLRIRNAWLPDGLDLSDTRLASGLFVEFSRIDGDVNMAGATVPGGLTFDADAGSPEAPATFNMRDLQVAGTLTLFDYWDEPVEDESDSDGEAAFPDAWRVDLDGARVRGDVVLFGEFETFRAVGATVEGTFDGTFTVFGGLTLDAARVNGPLQLNGATVREGVDLVHASIGDDIVATGAQVDGFVTMDSVEVAGSVVFTETSVGGPVDFDNARIGRDLRLNRSEFRSTVDLESARIGVDVRADCRSFLEDQAFELEGQAATASATSRRSPGGAVEPPPDACTFRHDLLLNGAEVGGRFTAVGASADDVRQDAEADAREAAELAEEAVTLAEELAALAEEALAASEAATDADEALDLAFEAASLAEEAAFMAEAAELLVVAAEESAAAAADAEARGVRFEGNVVMEGAEFGRDVMLDGASVAGDVLLRNAAVGSGVSMEDGTFGVVSLVNAFVDGDVTVSGDLLALELNAASVGGSVLVTATGGTTASVFLINAEVANDVTLSEAVGDLVSASVGGSVVIFNAGDGDDEDLPAFSLSNADIGGDVSIDGKFGLSGLFHASVGGRVGVSPGSDFPDGLDLVGASVVSDVVLDEGSYGCGVQLANIQVGGTVTALGSSFDYREGCFEQALLLDGAEVAGDVRLGAAAVDGFGDGPEFRWFAIDTVQVASLAGQVIALEAAADDQGIDYIGPVELDGARVGGDLDLTGASFGTGLSLSGSDVGGVLRFHTLGASPATWEGGLLDMRGADVGGVVEISNRDDALALWPEVRLAGFSYGSTVERAGAAARDEGFLDHNAGWYATWLEKEPEFSRAPYLALEAALRDEGRTNVAEDVAIARRDRELQEDGAWYERALGFVHKWTVGYGHKPEWSVYWIIGLIVLGWVVGRRLLRTDKGRNLGIGSPLLFSIDRLLPLVTLREAYAEVDIEEMPKRFQFYFGLHVFAGYALAAALVTAFSGLAGG